VKTIRIRYIYYFSAIILLALGACNERNDLGIEILPGSDLVNIKNVVIKDDISAFTYTEDSVRTSGANNQLIGSLNDPLFGHTTSNFAAQFRLQFFPDFGTNPVADSVKLYLYYRNIFGDTITPQHFKVYELEEGLDADANYTQEIDLKSMAGTELLGEITYTPKIRIDSVRDDTTLQLMVIPLDISLAEKILAADSLDLVNNDVFLEYFKGLYVESEKVLGPGGTLMSLETASTGSFQGSAIAIFYNNDENKAKAEPDTLLTPLVISKFSARVNSITHDYTGTDFYDNLNQDVIEDPFIYVQPTGGLKAFVKIDDLSSWKDSVNTAINKAELVFQIDTLASDIETFAPPRNLIFTFIDEDGEERLPIDFYFQPNFYDGNLKTDNTYRFNITQHVQQIIEGNVSNEGFFLTTGQRSDIANRVVLEGSEKGIQLLITYTTFKQ
jgi:hypothetical protein